MALAPNSKVTVLEKPLVEQVTSSLFLCFSWRKGRGRESNRSDIEGGRLKRYVYVGPVPWCECAVRSGDADLGHPP